MSSCNYESKGVAVSANSIKKAKMAVKVSVGYLQAWPEGFELWKTGQTTLARTVKAGLGLSFSRHF